MRITVAVVDRNPVHSRLSVWVNGGLITQPGGICLRNEEVEEFTQRLRDPEPELPIQAEEADEGPMQFTPAFRLARSGWAALREAEEAGQGETA